MNLKVIKNIYLSIEWKILRQKVFKRDKFKCTKCDSTKILQCHHLYYLKDKLAWQYPLSAFKTLCKKCHTELHKKNPGKKLVVKKKVTKTSRKEKLYNNLSPKDKELQNKRDNLKNNPK